MAFTTMGITSLILNIVFLAIITWFIIRYFEQKKRIKKLVEELGTDSLEHYLNEIKKKGFDFTLKPKGKGKK
ncbi:MAG: hypothetical protein KAK00_07965 [Nanoarchaeota archaeon]|nr:hypothetical protein [Nanoarchaeota archaeon]